MTVTQVIKLTTNKGAFIIELEKNNGYKFAISPLNYPDTWMLENKKVFNSIDSCFKNVILGIQSYCNINDINIFNIDNLCNCELLSLNKEKEILNNIKMILPIKINGNIHNFK